MLSLPLVRFTATAIRRDRIVQLVLVLMALGVMTAMFLGGAAVTEQKAYTVAASATILRIIAVLGLVVFISFFLRRSFESREIDYLLATPLTRTKLLASFAAAFMLLALLLTAAIGICVGVLSGKFSAGWLLWTSSAAVELMITAMITLFFACVLRSATVATLCSLGYYTLARMMGVMIGIVEAKLDVGRPLFDFMGLVVQMLAKITPRFDLMSQSAWLVYNDATGLAYWILPVQLVVFVLLFFVCAAFDLRRVQF